MQHTHAQIEEWRPVVGYEGSYEVSAHGRVRSVDRTVEFKNGVRRSFHGRAIKPQPTKGGHLRVTLCLGDSRRKTRVHRLVLEAFVGPCPEGMEGCHNDGNPQNNHVDNLRWDTRGNNCLDTVKHGRNPMTIRNRCPRGHDLSAPNLRASHAKRGYRTCLACDRAKAYARKYNKMDRFEEIADQRYAEIMSD